MEWRRRYYRCSPRQQPQCCRSEDELDDLDLPSLGDEAEEDVKEDDDEDVSVKESYLNEDFVNTIFELAQKNDILTIADEVQTGNGRTGKLYGYMNYGVTPDIVTTAKGLGGGLPMGATLLGEKVQDVYQPGSHGSTFGGNHKILPPYHHI